jgi:IS30 family transposase
LEWSPQQIAAHLRVAYPDRPDWHLCHESIYQALYQGGEGGLSRQLTRPLRTGRPLRKRRRRPDTRRVRFVAPALLLDHRPAVVEQRVRVGDWEGDLLVGRMSQSAGSAPDVATESDGGHVQTSWASSGCLSPRS